jgi:hypothetical protein
MWIVPSRKCASWTKRGTRCADVGTLVPWNSHLCAGLTARRTRMNAAWDRRPAGPGRTSGSSTEENAAQVRPVRRLSLLDQVLERTVWKEVRFSVGMNIWKDTYSQRNPLQPVCNYETCHFMRFEISTEVVMNITVFWGVTPGSPVDAYQGFWGTWRINLQHRRVSRAWIVWYTCRETEGYNTERTKRAIGPSKGCFSAE